MRHYVAMRSCRRVVWLASAVVLLAGADGAQGAVGAAAPVLSEVVLQTPSVAAGGAVGVAGTVRRTPRGRPGEQLRVGVYLAARWAGGRAWLGSLLLRAPSSTERRRFRLRVGVPAGVWAGRYGVLVCARARAGGRLACRHVGPVAITGGAPKVPSGFTAGARSIGDELYPAIGNGGYDARTYRLELAYTPSSRRLRGSATMLATATQDLRSLSLDLQGLAVRRVSIDDRPAFYRRRGTKLLVTPTAGIVAGMPLRVTVAYGGGVRPVREPSSGRTGLVPTPTGALVISQPIGAQNWFPSNNTPADKATFDVRMRVPAGLQVLGNGHLVSRRRGAAGTTFRWVEATPMATSLVTATLGCYEIRRSRSGGLELYSGIDRGPGRSRRLLARQRALLARVKPDIDRLARLLGPYPFDSAGAIVVNAPDLDDALETQTRPVYAGEFDTATQIHELAHQWFGDLVTITRWRDVWLQEGLTTWAEWWGLHAANPRAPTTAEAAARTYRRSERHRGRLRPLWKPLIVTHPRDLFGDAVYERGAMLVEALRQRVGQAAFERIIHSWLTEHRFGNAATQDFIALSARESGQPLGDLFDDWLYTKGKPTVSPPRAGHASPAGASHAPAID